MSVLKDLLEQRDGLSAELEGITQAAEASEDALTEEQESRSTQLLSEIDDLDANIAAEKRQVEKAKLLSEARALVSTRDAGRSANVSVEKEPMVYGPDSPQNSWWSDQIATQRGSMDPRRKAAEERLSQWSHQVERELTNGSKVAGAIEKQFLDNEDFREGGAAKSALAEARARGSVAGEDKEVRAIGSGGGATASAGGGGGAAFVTPYFLALDSYAPYREYGRAFLDACNIRPLPAYGMEVYVPAVTGPAGVTSQTEAAAVGETDPTFGYLSAGLITLAGQVTVSQQQLDRTGPGFDFDSMLFDQLERDYAPKADVYTITQALANATAQAWTGNSGVFVLSAASGPGGFFGQVHKAEAAMRKLAGTVMNPTHLFLDPARWAIMESWGDPNTRPTIVPIANGPYNAVGNSGDGNAGVEGAAGAKFAGLPVYTDANIPTPGTGTDQAIVGALNEVWAFEGSPVHRVLPQTLGANLQVIVQRYSYLAVLVRYPKALTAISGTGMSAYTYTT